MYKHSHHRTNNVAHHKSHRHFEFLDSQKTISTRGANVQEKDSLSELERVFEQSANLLSTHVCLNRNESKIQISDIR